MRRAEQAARSYLGDMYFDTGGKTLPRLLVGEDDGLQGLRALLQDLANDGDGADAPSFATQSAFGRLATQQQIIKSLQIQMMAAALLDHPGTGAGIRREQVRRPIIIVGPPRTGTTFLHRAIARHPQVQYLPYFEALETIAQPSKKQVNRNDV